MKTTLELPDELMRVLKVKAATENRRLKDIVEEAIRRGLEEHSTSPRGKVVISPHTNLPVIRAQSETVGEIDIEAVLLEQELEWHGRSR